jgi:NAD-dependent dihydropyrimidine dehydrogenase PreA subunit
VLRVLIDSPFPGSGGQRLLPFPLAGCGRTLWATYYATSNADPAGTANETEGESPMIFIIAEPCHGVCDTACVDVCPVDCIHPDEGWKKGDDPKGKMLYIDPEECIGCGLCEPECPVEAIFDEDEVPAYWQSYIKKNYEFFGREYKG